MRLVKSRIEVVNGVATYDLADLGIDTVNKFIAYDQDPATLYTVSRDADQWHLSYLWRAGGATYVVSEHVAPPYSFAQVKRNVTRLLRSLVLVPPAA